MFLNLCHILIDLWSAQICFCGRLEICLARKEQEPQQHVSVEGVSRWNRSTGNGTSSFESGRLT